MIHNEDSRVKIPAIAHFVRLGYRYESKKGADIDSRNNIFVSIFKESLERINDRIFSGDEINELIREIAKITDNNRDKGKEFFSRLTEFNAIKLIDFDNIKRNSFSVVSELTFRREKEEFRPDITVLINGIPLAFFEVKKPNNRKGIQAEFDRMKKERLLKKHLVPFMNQLQIIAFSNNMEYNDASKTIVQGSFYTTPNGMKTSYNHFREEKECHVNEYMDENKLKEILVDNNVLSILGTAEFNTNMDIHTPANSFVTSVFSKERLMFFIKYGIVYVDSARDGLQKHIIRYPQYFALLELKLRLEKGYKKGVVWHTQGSGKTALSYFASNVLRDYYQEKNIITKFYFVVDRLDLLNQASSELSSRGMSIADIKSKEDFVANIKSPDIMPKIKSSAYTKGTMNVVNIQKFSEEAVVDDDDCSLDIQRIYFLDEVHRSYKPKGSFLANLFGADKNGIFIGLTGTPLLKNDYKSTDIFGGYIHKYYYNQSIADRYTLRIKKEEISTIFKEEICRVLKIKPGQRVRDAEWATLGKTEDFCNKVSEYVQQDFADFKKIMNDKSLGCMIVTSSSEQARAIQKWFEINSRFKTALVLHDEEENKQKQKDYQGESDGIDKSISPYNGVIVYQMLLTGFDAPRLKRLYLLRKVREHNLLQTLARVNRPYGEMQYGYVVDFVDITEEYESTNRRYLEELKTDLVVDEEDVNQIFVNVEHINEQVMKIKNKLFSYDLDNLENFQLQISNLKEDNLREIKESLTQYRECYYELRLSHQYEAMAEIPIERINNAYYEVSNRLSLIIAGKIIDNREKNLIDLDLGELVIKFLKMKEVNLEFMTENDMMERINKIKNALSSNADQDDEVYKYLHGEFSEIIKRFKDEVNNTQETIQLFADMDELLSEIHKLNTQNNGLTVRYKGDEACMRIHKKMIKRFALSPLDIYDVIMEIVGFVNNHVKTLYRPDKAILERNLKRPVKAAFKKKGINLNSDQILDVVDFFAYDIFGYSQ
ncbi:type I restriction enzyme R subunit [Bacillus sp. RC240]|uniref:type I restriction endonuclease n=1 Tax=Bacillus sp. RC240 TaxID=3156285 RepID=UPI003833E862